MLTVGVATLKGSQVFSSTHWIGIPIALLGAIFLALGTIYQDRGVEADGKRETRIRNLMRRPVWLFGTSMLGAAVVLQLSALRFSPLMVIQPIGASALVVTALAKAAHSHRLPGRRKTLAIILCIAGIVAFVSVASFSAQDVQPDERHLRNTLILLACVVAAALAVWVWTRRHPNAAAATAGAGVLYGFVATLAKSIIGRLVQGNFDWLSLTGLAGMAVALALGASLVQKAHASGSEELVVAGLTVVDPMVAVILGIVVLGEAENAPPLAFAGFLAAGAAAIAGVWLMSTREAERSAAPR
jgi:drug/metabolite transporter (DMT)-like permease